VLQAEKAAPRFVGANRSELEQLLVISLAGLSLARSRSHRCGRSNGKQFLAGFVPFLRQLLNPRLVLRRPKVRDRALEVLKVLERVLRSADQPQPLPLAPPVLVFGRAHGALAEGRAAHGEEPE
jgi:hypothetical protein